jgi:hypothetical protein
MQKYAYFSKPMLFYMMFLVNILILRVLFFVDNQDWEGNAI